MPDHNDPNTPPHKAIDAASSPAADALTPIPPPDLDSDITDELTDHLSLAARDLQLAGHAADEAQQIAHQKFGDVAAIRRRLWWIQKGDEIMLRAAFAVVLLVLILAVAALGIGGWRISQTMNELGDSLATMNETQRALLANREKEDRPLAIRGRLYLGDKSKPASYASVDVYSLPEAKKVDTLMADEEGRFGTSSLPAGHYTILAPLVATKNEPSHRFAPDFFAIQSRPISVYPWSKHTTLELDVAMVDYGQVSVELAKPFPREIKLTDGGKEISIYPSLVIAIPSSSKEVPVQRLGAEALDWPMVGLHGVREAEHDTLGVRDLIPAPPTEAFDNVANAWLEPRELAAGQPIVFRRVLPTTTGRRSDAFRAGSYQVEAYVYCRLVAGAGGSPFSEATQSSVPREIDTSQLPQQSRCAIDVVDGRRAHLQVTPPDNLEKTLREDISKVLALADADQLLSEQRKARPVKLEFLGQQDLIEPEKLNSRKTDAPVGGYGGTR